MKDWGLVRGAVVAMVSSLAWSCAADCEDEIAAAQDFLSVKANLACETDADCVVVTTGCHTFDGGFCSQSHLSRSAANSAKWASLERDLDECEAGNCTVCGGALPPGPCANGRCGGPE